MGLRGAGCEHRRLQRHQERRINPRGCEWDQEWGYSIVGVASSLPSDRPTCQLTWGQRWSPSWGFGGSKNLCVTVLDSPAGCSPSPPWGQHTPESCTPAPRCAVPCRGQSGPPGSRRCLSAEPLLPLLSRTRAHQGDRGCLGHWAGPADPGEFWLHLHPVVPEGPLPAP